MKAIQAPNPVLGDQEFKQEVFRLWPLATLRVTASNITLSQETYIIVSATTNVILSVPPASQNDGMLYKVKKAMASANTLTISALGADLIDGSANFTWSGIYESFDFLCDRLGSRWLVF